MDTEQFTQLCNDCITQFSIATWGGLTLSTFLSFIGYGVFKAISLLNIYKNN